MIDFLIGIDRSLFLFFNKTLANPVFDVFFLYITEKRHWYVPIGIVIIVFLIRAKDKRRAGTIIGLALLVLAISDPLCVRVLKPLFGRLRPCHPSYYRDGKHIFLVGSRLLLEKKMSLSLPSAHAMNSFAQATHLALWFPRRRVWFFVIASLVAVSRVYVGVHYPFDVFLGALLGILVGASVFYAYQGLCTIISGKPSTDTQVN